MKYTKDNIVGKVFIHDKTKYLNLRIESDRLWMTKLDRYGKRDGEEFFGFVNGSLDYFNDGTWKIQEEAEAEEPKINDTYKVF